MFVAFIVVAFASSNALAPGSGSVFTNRFFVAFAIGHASARPSFTRFAFATQVH